ncbi:Major facilitator superfamily [Kalmanozyma brasiliensis GHG001]|uniref:Major facilitator superfamily (MFS) profile domain-containing protein n=1 Tax=Kalmanozyma brasiliensis (strain GHG001) TaxID=1365824 RepID=V5EFX9_KALBG|nr:Major facilitator superfamily [Kalmanozyma brasiliensis GHG001]EST09451.1 Major facilitator superfamily [Kalmanozyma brasiliensis GHG001]
MPVGTERSPHTQDVPNDGNRHTWNRDVYLLLAARFVRMTAFGSSSLVLALFLSSLDQTPVQVGRFLTLTLVGDFLLSFVLTFTADSLLGRRNTLRLGALSMLLSGLVFATASNVNVLLVAAIFGVISPSGGEIGPFRAVEESILAGLVDKQHRPALFGSFIVTGALAASLSTWLGGLLNKLVDADSRDAMMWYYRCVFVVYAVMGLLKLLLSLSLSDRCEVRTRVEPQPAREADERDPLLSQQAADPPTADTPFSNRRFALLCTLFAIDSLGSGMASQTLTSWFLSRKFNAELASLGSILSAALLVSATSNLFSARIAKRLGLVVTMVVTHLPANIFLAMIPLPSGLGLTSALIVARAATSSMDQAPRSAFLSAFVPDHQRTRVLGLVTTVQTLAQSGGPSLTGWFAEKGKMGWAFHTAGALKAGYDLGLLAAFSAVN